MPIRIARPGKVVCVGLNYRDHALEGNLDIPTSPLTFAKYPSCLIGPGDPIVIPTHITQCDYEGELGVVIGTRCKAVSVENARKVILGYVCANDVTARDIQAAETQFTRAKSPDTFGPVGPLVKATEIPDPHALRIRTYVNGEVVQDSNTSQLIFGIDEVISFISQTSTLEPGDLILTGTPAGVGLFHNPPRLLTPGDVVAVEIESVGKLTNPVVAQFP